MHNDLVAAQKAVTSGCDPNTKVIGPFPYKSILEMAVYMGSKEMVELLLDNGGDLHSKGYMGRSLLHLAVLRRRKGTTQLLLSKGLSPYLRALDGKTPMYYASIQNDPAIISLLQKAADK